MSNLNGYSLGTGFGSLCVGREAELAKLRMLYERSTEQGGHCVVISGNSGVGKSRLLQEYKRRARLDGICVLEGRCRFDRRTYQPFLEIVRDATSYLADLAPSLFQASRSMEIVEGLSGNTDGQGALDSAAADLGNLRCDRWEDRRTALYESVGDLLLTVAQVRPPTVIIHDIQLADDDTLALLGHLLATLSSARALQGPHADNRFNGLFTLSERIKDETAPVAPRLLSGVSHTMLPLDGLDRAGVEAFLSAPTVVSRFVEVTGGNPRQIEAFLEQRHADADNLFIDRVDALPRPAAAFTAALAVLGHPTNPRILGRMTGLEAAEIGPATERCLKAEILVSSIRDGNLELTFKSTSDQDAVLASVSQAQRAELHDRAGDEMLCQGNVVSAAEHLLQGSGQERAAEIALQAGERLEIAFAYERAIDLYERALDRAHFSDLRHELEERLCDLLELTGEYERAVELTERLAGHQPAPPRFQRRLGHLHLQQGAFSQARTCLESALSSLGPDGDAADERTLILSDLAEVAYLEGEHREAKAKVEQVLASLADERPLPAVKVKNTLGKVHLERGDFQLAEEIFGQNLETSRHATLVAEEIRALINLGIARLRQGRYEEAAECYRAGLSASEASHDYRHRAFCLQNLGVLAHWRRDYTSALQLFHDAVQTFLKLGHKSWLSWLALDLGDLYLELGEPVRAESMLELSGTLSDQKSDSQTPLFTDMLRGKLAAYEGAWEDAESLFEAAQQKATRAEKSDEAATASLELVRVLLQTERAEQAAELAQQWIAAPTLKTRAEAKYLLGEAGLRGAVDRETTHLVLQSAQALYERVGDAFGLWSVLTRRAELAELDDDPHAAARFLSHASRVEAGVRKTVPEELLDSYLNHPRRRPLLQRLGVEPPRPAAEQRREVPLEPTATRVPSPRSRAQRRPRPARYEKRYADIVGEHEELLRVFDLVDKIAPLDSTVLIRGESGTGKELIAEAIHHHSQRSQNPLVRVNCGALVESLLLSELFGHERGAFTGASRRKKGRFEVADGGTIFLDEIGDITPKTQVALLRVLQEKEFERVGGNSPIRVDVRIVCATNRNLEEMVREGSFREDLYYRLKAFQIEVPPLRTRASDIVLLAHHFLEAMTEQGECPKRTLQPQAEQTLMSWDWPGNVRELQNVLRSVSLLAEGEAICSEDLREFIPQAGTERVATPAMSASPLHPAANLRVLEVAPPEPTHSEPAPPEPPADVSPEVTSSMDSFDTLIRSGVSLHEYKKKVEAECIARALRQTEGNITRAAELLKMKRPRLSQLVKQYGLSG